MSCGSGAAGSKTIFIKSVYADVSATNADATGGDNYDMFQYGTGVQFLGDKLRDALAEEIAFRTGVIITPAFTAESLTLQPGANATSLNFNWYSDRADNLASVVQIARKADVVNGNFPISGIITTTNGAVGDASDGKSWHRAGITGLEADTRYVYRVSNDGLAFSKAYEFKTGAEDTFKFAVTGDPQLTVGAQDSTSSYYSTPGTTAQGWKDSMSLIEEKGVDFIAGVGDQVDTTSNGSEAEYANFFAPEQMSSIPYAPAIGNHDRHYLFDYHYNMPNEQSFTPVINSGNTTNQQYQEMEVAGNYYYLYNNALFVVLNDSGYPESIEVAAKYIELFDKTLKTATDAFAGKYDWLFVQHHKSTASIADHVADLDIQYYVEAGFENTMDKYGVDFVLAGHDHIYARSYPMYNGVPDKTGAGGASNNTLIMGGDGANSAVNPAGTVYFTTTTASGLKYYELFNNANNLYVKDNINYPYLVDGKVGSAAYMEGNLPLSNAKYLQNKTPGFIVVTVAGSEVRFEYYDLSGEYRDTPYDTYTVCKAAIFDVVNASASAAVVSVNDTPTLVVAVTEILSDASVNTISERFDIQGDVAETYNVGSYLVYIEVVNGVIIECYIIDGDEPAIEYADLSALEAALVKAEPYITDYKKYSKATYSILDDAVEKGLALVESNNASPLTADYQAVVDKAANDIEDAIRNLKKASLFEQIFSNTGRIQNHIDRIAKIISAIKARQEAVKAKVANCSAVVKKILFHYEITVTINNVKYTFIALGNAKGVYRCGLYNVYIETSGTKVIRCEIK